MNTEHALVVVGGGIAGLDVATRLSGSRAGHERLAVTLVDRETAYVWKPMLHTIAAGTSDAGAQETNYGAQALTRGFRYEIGEVVEIDRKTRRLRLAPLRIGGEEIVPEREIAYDTLVLAVGSRANDFGTPGVTEHCQRIDSRSEALAFNDLFRMQLVKHAAAKKSLIVGIVGGGATGVELAAELIQFANVAERYWKEGVSRSMEVVLIESGARLLGPFPEKISASAQAKLKELGVAVRTSARVASVDATAFVLEGGERITAELKVWAAGVKAPTLIDTLADLDRKDNGRLAVGPTLRTPDDPHIFAIGDCASPQLPGRHSPVPTTAQAASQQAHYLCRYLPQLVAGNDAPPATYHDFGSLVSLGGYDAYGTLGRFGFFDGGFIKGRIAQLGHAMLYRSYQARLHGIVKGSLLWLIDVLARKVRPTEKLP